LEKKVIVRHLQVAASALACMAIAVSAMQVASIDDSHTTDLAHGGRVHADKEVEPEQPSVPAATLGATATNTPATVDGSAPTTLATPMATVDPDTAAKPGVICRHMDYCLPMTFGLHPADHQ
jgi:hypothetical protein